MEGGPVCVVLLWKTPRPPYGGMRMSSYFQWRGQEMRLELGTNDGYACLRLRWRRKPSAADLSFRSCVTAGSLFSLKHGCITSDSLERWTPETPARNIHYSDHDYDRWMAFTREEEWTVACQLNSDYTKDEDKVETETILLSTVDDTLPPAILSVDRCVQADVPRDTEALSRDCSRLLREELFPDFRLICEGRTFRVHRGLLAARSEFFRALFEHDVREGGTGEAVIETLQVPVLVQLLEFVYSGRLGEEVTDDGVARLYGAAGSFAVPSLSAACARRVLGGLSEGNCVAYLEEAERHSDPDLKDEAMSFFLQHPGVFRSDAWREFSERNPTLAVQVFQTYFTSVNP